MTDKSKTVCFSGHRVLYEAKETVEKSLETTIRQSIANGVDTFITGGAIGVDTIAAQVVIQLRREYPNKWDAVAKSSVRLQAQAGIRRLKRWCKPPCSFDFNNIFQKILTNTF